MQAVALRPFEVAAVQSVIGLEVADDGLDRLASLEQRLVLVAQALEAAPVLDVQAGVVFVGVSSFSVQ